ncbi:MAG: ABC transporter substrate-binding protein [Gemmatimonadetes bacterium]|nr:ABC transporter substrate-binding protein [Gemmatimonadota bacterium]
MRSIQPVRRARRTVVALSLALGAACGGGEKQGEAAASAPTPGVANDTITVGTLVPLSDAVALIGKPILAGEEAYFAELNAKGGIGGKYKVKVISEDVTYANPSTSVQKYNKIKDQIAAFAMILGTDHVNVTLPLMAEDNILAIPTTFDAEWVREPHLIPTMSPYQVQVANGIDYWWNKAGGQGKPICTMSMATGYGQAGDEGAAIATKALGTTVASAAKFRPGDQDFVAQVTQLKNANCAAVALTSLPTETAKIMGTAAQLGFNARWIATSPTWHQVLGKSPIAAYAKEHLWTSTDMASPADTATNPAVQEILNAQRKYTPEQVGDFYFVAGWAFAKTLHTVLEAAATSGDLSRAGIAKALTSLGDVDMQGVVGNYRYGAVESREPPRATNIYAIDPSVLGGFTIVERGYASEAAKAIVFTKKR